jgi:hypothetical protein
MIKRSLLVLLVVWFVLADSNAQSGLSKSDMAKLDFSILATNKAKIKEKDLSLIPAYNQLLSKADALLKYKPVSVMAKTEVPPSGDRHDYMSMAPYWWPDSTRPDGLPYIRKDGQVNPDVKNYPDKENLPKLCETVYFLSLAYFFSDNEKYAAHACRLIQVWFLDSATKMNPNLNFGQSIKGVTTGRGAGLIDTRHLIFLIDALGLLNKSNAWSEKNDTAIKKWFSDFLNWMQSGRIGMEELNADNNHGVWYDAQRLSFAAYINDKELAEKIILNAVNRLDQQMDEMGSFPEEMKRTMSLHYSVFVLNAFVIIAQGSENSTIDFWNIKTNSGKSLKKAFEFIRPFISREKEWKGTQITEFDFRTGYPVLLKGSLKYNCNNCMEAIRKMEGDNFDRLLLNLL